MRHGLHGSPASLRSRGGERGWKSSIAFRGKWSYKVLFSSKTLVKPEMLVEAYGVPQEPMDGRRHDEGRRPRLKASRGGIEG
jgi:hypothetical protein